MPTPMNATITQLGSFARACLTPGQCGKVLAVFSKAIYLLTETDELLWIATEDVPIHRRCMTISPHLPAVSAGSSFRVADHCLLVDRNFAFEIGDSPLWIAPRSNQILDIESLPASIHYFFSRLDISQAKGLGNIVPQILSPARSNFRDPILHYAQPLVLEMAFACLEHRPFRLAKIADELVGLGAGLTPSGDDFLGGMCFAIHYLQSAYPALDFKDYAIAIDLYRSRTNSISFTLLKDHASGHAVEPLHRILNGILSGEAFESLSPSVSQLTRIGHSTGWDLLTGLLTGLLTTVKYQSLPTLESRSKYLEMLVS